MMRIGWLADHAEVLGGAELTQAEFRAAAPDTVEIVDCLPGHVIPGLDRYVVQNCVQYTTEDLEPLAGTPITKFWHDVGPHLQPGVREWLDGHAAHVCCSPVQADYMDLTGKALVIPPPVDMNRFAEAAARVNGSRKGAVSVAAWRNHGKAAHQVVAWAAANNGGGVDFYGNGPFAPPGAREIAYEGMPALLARYETFVFLPTVLEPFGRTVVEAWAAGCEIVTNRLVGALWWLENDIPAIQSAADDFWTAVLA